MPTGGVVSLLNPLVYQDHIPLGIICIASWLLELVAALFDPVMLPVILILKDLISTVLLVEGDNLLPGMHPIWQKLLHSQDPGICLVICFALHFRHPQQGRG
jgi:hypothetical protein